jgi:hypothetical protein
MWNSSSYLRLNFGLRLAAASLTAVCVCGEVRAVLVIDNFETGQALTMTAMTGAPVFSGIVDPNAVGGHRVAALNSVNAPTMDHTLTIDDAGNGRLTFSSDPADQAFATLNYTGDTIGNVVVPGVQVDLSVESVVQIDSRSDQAAVGILFVYTDSTNWSQWNFQFPGNGLLVPFETISIDLASTSPNFSSGVGAVLGTVAAFSFVIDHSLTPGATVQIDHIQATAVPEPSAAMFAGISLLCAAGLAQLSYWLQAGRNSRSSDGCISVG